MGKSAKHFQLFEEPDTHPEATKPPHLKCQWWINHTNHISVIKQTSQTSPYLNIWIGLSIFFLMGVECFMTLIMIRSKKLLSSWKVHLEQQAQTTNGISIWFIHFFHSKDGIFCFEYFFAKETVLILHHMKRMDSHRCIPSYIFTVKSPLCLKRHKSMNTLCIKGKY